MRATTHNGRASQKGAYLAKHNDRQFNLDEASHINQDKTIDNIYWHCMLPEHPEMTFEQVEQAFYNHEFRAGLESKNNIYKHHGNDKYIQSMDEYRRNPRSCPEEQIFMLGNKDFHVPIRTLEQICRKQLVWEEQTFPQVKILNYAVHADEKGAPHIHIRRAWIGHDKGGNKVIGQNKALKEMGIERPDMNKPQSRYNNAKMTYTVKCREHLIELCKDYGIDIDTQPRERSQTGLSLTEYQTRQEEQRARQIEQGRDAARAERERIRGALTHARTRAERAQQRAQEQQAQNDALRAVESQIRAQMEREQRMSHQLADMNEKARRKLKRTDERLQELEPYLQAAERRQVAEIIRRQEREHELTR